MNRQPPIGLRPRWMVEEDRLEEIVAAFQRCLSVCQIIKPEWLEEYNELAAKVQKRQELQEKGAALDPLFNGTRKA